MELPRPVWIRAGDDVEMLRLCRLHDGLKHFVSQPRTVDDGIDARAEGFDGVEPANLALMRHTAQKRAVDAPAAASLTAQLACENAVGAAAELRKSICACIATRRSLSTSPIACSMR